LRPETSDAAVNERDDSPGTDTSGPPSAQEAADATDKPEATGQASDAGNGQISSAEHLSPEGIPASLPDYLDQVEREAISCALEKTRFNRTAAAKLLGISFRALRYRMQRLEIN